MIDFALLQSDIDEALGLNTLPPDTPPDFDENGAEIDPNDLPEIEDSFGFCEEDLPDSAELIQGLLHQGTKMVLGGGSKSFKTWMQMDLAVSVAYGLKWMGFQATAGRVLFVNFEIKRNFFQKRLKKIAEARGVKQEKGRLDVWNLRGHSSSYHIIIPKIVERIRNSGYVLVVLDPVYKLYGNTDENSASEVAQMLNSLEMVCVETDAAIVFGAHYSKGNQSTKDAIDRISGSGVFARDPDSILPFTKHEEENCFTVEPILRNLPPVSPFVVSWNYPIMERDDGLDPSKLAASGGRPKTKTKEDLLALLNDGPLHVKKWEENALNLAQISRASFFRLKTELKSHGLIMYSRLNDNWVKLEKQQHAE